MKANVGKGEHWLKDVRWSSVYDVWSGVAERKAFGVPGRCLGLYYVFHRGCAMASVVGHDGPGSSGVKQ